MRKFLAYTALFLGTLNIECFAGGPGGDISLQDLTGVVRLHRKENKPDSKGMSGGTGALIALDENVPCRHVLTNAHCAYEFLKKSILDAPQEIFEFDLSELNIGEFSVCNYTREDNGIFGVEEAIELCPVQKIILHPRYNNKINRTDLAILVLQEPINQKTPFLIKDTPLKLWPNKVYHVDGFGMTGDLSTYPFKLESTSVPRRMNVCIQEKEVSCSIEGGYTCEGFPAFQSYYLHEEWIQNEEQKEEIISIYGGLNPSASFVYKGDSGSPLYDLETKEILGVTTFGHALEEKKEVVEAEENFDLQASFKDLEKVFLIKESNKLEIGCEYDPVKHQRIPSTSYTPLTPELKKWITEKIK